MQRDFLVDEITNGLDDSIFTGSGATSALTTLHDVQPGQAEFVRDTLSVLEGAQLSRQALGLHHLHYGLLADGKQLLFTAVIDAPARQHLAEFMADNVDLLDPLWRSCVGYPERGFEDAPGLAGFLIAGCQRGQLVLSGYSGATVKEVRKALDWMRKTMHYQIELAKSPRNGA